VTGTRDAPARPRRDGATWLIYAQYAIFGFFLYAFTPSVTLLRDDEHVSDAIASLHSTCYAAGVVIAGVVGARMFARLGRTVGLWLSLAGLGLGVAVYVCVALVPVTLIGAMILGLSGSGLVIAVGAMLADHHGPAAPAAITEANGVSAGVGLLAPLAVGASVSLGYGWRPALLLTIPAIAVLFVTRRAFTPAETDASATTVTQATASEGGRLGGQFWLSWTIVVLCVGIEFCMTLWCAQLLRERAGLSAGAAATGVTAIVLGMCTGRFVGVRIAARRDIDWMLTRAFALTAVGFAVFWVSRTGWLSFAGLLVCGLGLASHYPLGVARSIRAAAASGPGLSDVASSLVALGTGIAIGLAPFVLGFLADGVGIRAAFLLVPVLLALASGTLVLARRPHDREHRVLADQSVG
jgi:predicted MFS family arabinose efflux permease